MTIYIMSFAATSCSPHYEHCEIFESTTYVCMHVHAKFVTLCQLTLRNVHKILAAYSIGGW